MQRHEGLYIKEIEPKGRGVFTYMKIREGEVLEVCPVIIIPHEQVAVIHQTILHDYYFLWGEDDKEAAIALGFGSLYNHALYPNAKYLIDEEYKTIDFVAIRDIKAGEEITVNYNGEAGNNDPLWFTER